MSAEPGTSKEEMMPSPPALTAGRMDLSPQSPPNAATECPMVPRDTATSISSGSNNAISTVTPLSSGYVTTGSDSAMQNWFSASDPDVVNSNTCQGTVVVKPFFASAQPQANPMDGESSVLIASSPLQPYYPLGQQLGLLPKDGTVRDRSEIGIRQEQREQDHHHQQQQQHACDPRTPPHLGEPNAVQEQQQSDHKSFFEGEQKHEGQQQITVDAKSYKTRMCENIVKGGFCPYETRCSFAHGPEDTRTVEQNIADGITTMEELKRHQTRVTIEYKKKRRTEKPPSFTDTMSMQHAALAKAEDTQRQLAASVGEHLLNRVTVGKTGVDGVSGTQEMNRLRNTRTNAQPMFVIPKVGGIMEVYQVGESAPGVSPDGGPHISGIVAPSLPANGVEPTRVSAAPVHSSVGSSMPAPLQYTIQQGDYATPYQPQQHMLHQQLLHQVPQQVVHHQQRAVMHQQMPPSQQVQHPTFGGPQPVQCFQPVFVQQQQQQPSCGVLPMGVSQTQPFQLLQQPASVQPQMTVPNVPIGTAYQGTMPPVVLQMFPSGMANPSSTPQTFVQPQHQQQPGGQR